MGVHAVARGVHIWYAGLHRRRDLDRASYTQVDTGSFGQVRHWLDSRRDQHQIRPQLETGRIGGGAIPGSCNPLDEQTSLITRNGRHLRPGDHLYPVFCQFSGEPLAERRIN